MKREPNQRLKYRTIWISDVHLGYKDCKADFLLDFLKSTESETLYLVGDVIDIWALKRSFYWPQKHHAVIKQIFKKAKSGTKVYYIPGNHDELSRDLVGQTIMGVKIKRNHIHKTADNRRLLLCHGDEFDFAVKHSRLTKLLGDVSYDILLLINRWSNWFRKRFGLHYWSLATYIKNRVRNARQAIELFEVAAADEARRQNLDGVVCGHIHQPEIRKINDVLYCNDGDWVESCTAMIEDQTGWLEIIHWSDLQQSVKSDKGMPENCIPIMTLPKVQK